MEQDKDQNRRDAARLRAKRDKDGKPRWNPSRSPVALPSKKSQKRQDRLAPYYAMFNDAS